MTQTCQPVSQEQWATNLASIITTIANAVGDKGSQEVPLIVDWIWNDLLDVFFSTDHLTIGSLYTILTSRWTAQFRLCSKHLSLHKKSFNGVIIISPLMVYKIIDAE